MGSRTLQHPIEVLKKVNYKELSHDQWLEWKNSEQTEQLLYELCSKWESKLKTATSKAEDAEGSLAYLSELKGLRNAIDIILKMGA